MEKQDRYQLNQEADINSTSSKTYTYHTSQSPRDATLKREYHLDGKLSLLNIYHKSYHEKITEDNTLKYILQNYLTNAHRIVMTIKHKERLRNYHNL